MAHSFETGTCCWGGPGGLGRSALLTDGASHPRLSHSKRLKENTACPLGH